MTLVYNNMRQVQPETLPKNIIFLPVYKISSLKITLPKILQLITLDFLQQTITMIKDSVLFVLSSGFSVSFLFEKKIDEVYCSVFLFFLVAVITLFATRVSFILEIV